jgi:hypothetical protein
LMFGVGFDAGLFHKIVDCLLQRHACCFSAVRRWVSRSIDETTSMLVLRDD